MKKEKSLSENTVVSTVMSNLGLENYLAAHGIRLHRTKVGDRFVTERMLAGGYVLGGEPSGHIISLNSNTTGDGPITALHILCAMKKEHAPLSGLVQDITFFPQVLINVPVAKKTDIKSSPAILEAIKEAESRLGSGGRVLVRPSGTEHAMRVMVEADDEKLVRRLAARIAEVIKKTMSS
jgi:phosphoglucosamine mutase